MKTPLDIYLQRHSPAGAPIAGSMVMMATLLSPRPAGAQPEPEPEQQPQAEATSISLSTLYYQPARAQSRYFPISRIFLLIQVDQARR